MAGLVSTKMPNQALHLTGAASWVSRGESLSGGPGRRAWTLSGKTFGMAFPKKSTRRIKVNDVEYQWVIRSYSPYPPYLDVVVVNAAGTGQRLSARFDEEVRTSQRQHLTAHPSRPESVADTNDRIEVRNSHRENEAAK